VASLSDDRYLTIVGSVASIANGSMRSVFALLMERFGFKKVVGTIVIIQICLSGTIGFINVRWLYGVYIAAAIGCMGGYFSCFPAQVTKVFGVK